MSINLNKEFIKMQWFKKHKVLSIIGVIMLLGIITSAGSGKKKNTSTDKNLSTNSKQDKVKDIKVGQPANDGKFEFTINSVECGKASVGSNPYLTKTAQGQYCLLNVSVKNIGDQAQSLFSSNQYLLNSNGQKYSADDMATIYNSPNGTSWYDNINPGNKVEGAILFDLPKDQTPTTAELHDSAFSSGVKITLQ